jgi:hypothetical protein
MVHAGGDAVDFRSRNEQANHHLGEFKGMKIARNTMAVVQFAKGLVANPRQFRDVLRIGTDEFNSIAPSRGGCGVLRRGSDRVVHTRAEITRLEQNSKWN